MALRDTFKNLFSYFEIDEAADVEEQGEGYRMEHESPRMRIAPAPSERTDTSQVKRSPAPEKTNLQRLNERQQELQPDADTKKTTIDIKFPKKYEEARDIVNLLLENASILIDFQYMSETQARRCLDYLDGARSVLAGNLKKVSNTMWLLTPVNVTVKIEELRTASKSPSDSQFDFDMRR